MCKRGVIIIIHKQGDSGILKKFEIDCFIVCGSENIHQIDCALPSITHPDQIWDIRERNSYNNISLVRDTIEHCNTETAL